MTVTLRMKLYRRKKFENRNVAEARVNKPFGQDAAPPRIACFGQDPTSEFKACIKERLEGLTAFSPHPPSW